jgi:hypothetical protein
MQFGKTAAFACAAVLGLGLAGCGSDSPSGEAAPAAEAGAGAPQAESPKLDPIAAVRESADKTRSAGTSRLEMVINAKTAGENVDITASGTFDYQKSVGELELALPAGTGLGSGTIRQIITKKALYMGGIPGLPEGKWVKVSLDKLDVSGGSGLTSNDPSAVLEMVRGASDDVTEVGEETVRGEKTTHYRGTLDLDKAVASAPAETRDQVKQYLEQAGTKSVPFDLYIDDEGRLRKMVQQFEFEAPGGSETVAMDLTLEMFDYGVKVNIKEPAAADVIEAPAGSLGGG